MWRGKCCDSWFIGGQWGSKEGGGNDLVTGLVGGVMSGKVRKDRVKWGSYPFTAHE